MKISRIAQLGAVAAIAALTLAGCASNETAAGGAPSESSGPALSGTLNGSGATSQQVAIQAWTAEFQTANPDVTVNYDPQGSGTGRESFQSGAVQFAGSDRPFKIEEIEAGPFDACAEGSDLVEIPAYVSPIAIAFNVEGVDSLNLDPATIAGIFAGTITKWNDPAIAATNADVTLPDLAITPVHRSDKSGTTANFTDYLSQSAGDVWTYGSVEEWPIQGGEAAQGTSGVVNAIKGGNGTIGYADHSQTADLSAVNVQVGSDWVEPSAEGAAKALDASAIEEGRAPTDLAFAIDRTTQESGAYPVMLVSYLIGCVEYKDSAAAELVKGFFSTAVSEAGQETAAKNAGSAPISSELATQSQDAIDQIK
ncbi:phosphate ABC transporter substrate-binding protein PstS [Microbacterium sp. 4R-513]|uniref:phosphate ABC transporter substrate-binding protein PstS n=1 Tax=Microbacterium sp. 4R-513 TaxID=2567934 RepID=UPI0013E15D15|nr:phosphate ABC transporter substrate-binding protein PstS [Microbacterium sp. 4R-513]QIG39984.1 phosphate ABC transporter substrate-binding protein PstS [Microbacterium sp. 4R-513]